MNAGKKVGNINNGGAKTTAMPPDDISEVSSDMRVSSPISKSESYACLSSSYLHQPLSLHPLRPKDEQKDRNAGDGKPFLTKLFITRLQKNE
jgi:hypothetical protein